MWIWPVYRGPNVPNSAASVSWEATIDAPSGLFRQFHDGVPRSWTAAACRHVHQLSPKLESVVVLKAIAVCSERTIATRSKEEVSV